MKFIKSIIFAFLIFALGFGCKYYFDMQEEKRLQTEARLLQARIYEKFVSKNKLVFGEQHYTDIMTYTETVDWLPDPSINLQIKGHVNLCIDLAKINRKDILVTTDSIFIQIPSLEICEVVIDHENSMVFNESNTFFSSADIVTKALATAKNMIYKKAVSDPLLEAHQEKAHTAIKQFLSLGSDKKIIIHQKRMASENLTTQR